MVEIQLRYRSAEVDLIAIIDYGMGNVGSIANMLRKVGAEATITSDPDIICSAEKLILPGVGAFDSGMRELSERGLLPVLQSEVVDRGKSILGVCLGMQLFAQNSEEGNARGLGWIPGRVVRFPTADPANPLKVPHMGWNTAIPVRGDPLFSTLGENARFYFVHAFHVECDQDSIVAQTRYGSLFVSALRHGNIAGVQFHPEKSHRFGMQLLRNFAGMS